MTLTHQLIVLLDEAQDYPLDVSHSISISSRQAQQILDDKEKLKKIEDIIIERWTMNSLVKLQSELKEVLEIK